MTPLDQLTKLREEIATQQSNIETTFQELFAKTAIVESLSGVLDKVRIALKVEEGQSVVEAAEALAAEVEEKQDTVSKYATAARVIALHLKEFCDESLPYDEMIAEAARKAASRLAAAEKQRDEAVKVSHEHFNDAKKLALQCMGLRVVLNKCAVQLDHVKAGYFLGHKIDEAIDEATKLLTHEPIEAMDALHERASLEIIITDPRPREDWVEDDGDCLWWSFPIAEPPYVGSPLCDGFPDAVTHFTMIPMPPASSAEEVRG